MSFCIDHLNRYVSDVDKFITLQFYLKDPDGFEVDFIQWTDKEGFYDNLKMKNRHYNMTY
jgi:hypothetical protein